MKKGVHIEAGNATNVVHPQQIIIPEISQNK
jgi:hypothetical protein